MLKSSKPPYRSLNDREGKLFSSLLMGEYDRPVDAIYKFGTNTLQIKPRGYSKYFYPHVESHKRVTLKWFSTSSRFDYSYRTRFSQPLLMIIVNVEHSIWKNIK